MDRGFSVLAMVMMILLMGMVLLNGLHRQMLTAARFNLEERRYLVAYHQAHSALQWGARQPWQVSKKGWQCLTPGKPDDFTVCLREGELPGEFLLRGESRQTLAARSFRLYQLMRLDEQRENTKGPPLVRQPMGWLDYCPLSQESLCQD